MQHWGCSSDFPDFLLWKRLTQHRIRVDSGQKSPAGLSGYLLILTSGLINVIPAGVLTSENPIEAMDPLPRNRTNAHSNKTIHSVFVVLSDLKKKNLLGFLFLGSRPHPGTAVEVSEYFPLTQGQDLKSIGALRSFLAWFLPGSSLPGNLWRVACTLEGRSGVWLWNFSFCLICSWRPAFKVFSINCLFMTVHQRHSQMGKGIWDVAQPWRYSLQATLHFPANKTSPDNQL